MPVPPVKHDPETVIVTDPEMMTAADAARIGVPVVAMGEGVSGPFASAEEMIVALTVREAALDADTATWQRDIAAPFHGTRQWGELTIYVEVPDIGTLIRMETALGAAPSENVSLAERVSNAAERGWFYARCYSVITPEGEWGCVHRSAIASLLSEGEFAAARMAGWPRVVPA